MRNMKGLVDLIRPFTLLAPIIVSLCIMAASFFYNQVADDFFSVFWMLMIPAGLSLAILNAASNALNQVKDYKTDKISKPYRPIPRKAINLLQGKIISILLYAFAISLSILINPVFTIFLVLIAFFTVTYSMPPRLKDKLFLNQIWVGIPRGLLGILASWSVFGNPIQALPLSIGLIATVFLIGGSITKDITDSDADKKTGTKTIVNVYGVKQAAFMSLPFMLFPFVFIPILVDLGIIESYFAILALLAIPAFFVFYLMIQDKKVKHLENTKSWALMYATYFFFAFCFSILTITGNMIG